MADELQLPPPRHLPSLAVPPPDGLRVSTLRVAGEALMVLSYPFDGPDMTKTPLTEAETDVARLAIEGLSNAAIARERGTAPRTIANQMAAILRKLGLGSRRELAALFARGAPLTGASPSEGSGRR